MKKLNKKNVLLACLSLSLVAGTAGAFAINNKTASANENTLKMMSGASLYLSANNDGVTGLKFSFTDSAYDANATYGMLIVANDMLEAAQAALAGGEITDVSENDYVNLIEAAQKNEVFNANDKPINVEVAPDSNGVFSHSVGSLNGYNYVREFIGIGYKVVGENLYEYAELDDNVRSVFEVANLALNCHEYDNGDLNGDGDISPDETEEKEKIASYKTQIQNYLTTGFEFVYGDATPTASFEATYVGGEIAPEVALTPLAGKEHIQPNIHWNYAFEGETLMEMTAEGKLKGIKRGQGTVNAGIGGVVEVPATASVLKDTTELQIFNDSKDVDVFGVDEESFATSMVEAGKAYSTAKFNGGHWNGAGQDDGYSNPGYFVIKNPNSEDGKYTMSTTKTNMDFYFTGNNMPNVEFFAADIENIDFGKYGGGTSGHVITNGIARSDTYSQYVNTVVPSYNSETGAYDTSSWKTTSSYYYHGIASTANFFRFGCSGYGTFNRGKYHANYNSYFGSSYALDSVYKTSGYNIMLCDSSTKLYSVEPATYGSKFSQYELMLDETQQWHYKVNIYIRSGGNNAGKPMFSAWLYSVATDGTETLYTSVSDKVIVNSKTEPTRKGYIVVHGACKGSKKEATNAGNTNYYYTELAYKMPY